MPYKRKQKGQVLIVINALMAILLIYGIALINVATTARISEKKLDLKIISQNIAEAGIAKALWCLNQTDGDNCGGSFSSNYSGETDIIFGGGIIDISTSDFGLGTKLIESTSYYPNKTAVNFIKSVIKIKAITDTDKISFSHGAQIGQGGLEMSPNSSIIGSVYSNGNIKGSNQTEITGDVYVAIGSSLTADQAYNSYNSDFIFGKSEPEVDIAQSFIPSISEALTKISIYIKKIGNPNNITVRIVADNSGAPDTLTLVSATLNSSIVSTNYGWIDIGFANPPSLLAGTTYWIVLDSSKNSTKYWTIGIDALDNYANGTMYYNQDWDTDPWITSGADINFKTWMGGVITKIENITIGGNLYANTAENVTVNGKAEVTTLTNSTIDGDVLANSIDSSTIGFHATTTEITNSDVGYDLWCQTYSNTTIGFTNHCPISTTPPTNPGPIELPISDAIISDWKTDAENGGIIEGDYTISDDSSFGPKKITGNLEIDGGVILTLTGTIYVEGTVTAGIGASIILDDGFGSNSGILISNNIITINNNVVFSGADTGSYILLLSTYSDPDIVAINIKNNTVDAILYAPDGIVTITNNAIIKQVNAGILKLSNNVELRYESGLSEINFSSGPSGGWIELKGSWALIE